MTIHDETIYEEIPADEQSPGLHPAAGDGEPDPYATGHDQRDGGARVLNASGGDWADVVDEAAAATVEGL